MTDHPDLPRPAKIVGLVSYLDETGIRRPVPVGEVLILEGDQIVTVRSISSVNAEYHIPLSDYVEYLRVGHIKLKPSAKEEYQ